MEEALKKLKFKDLATVINAPEDLKSDFVSLGLLTSLSENKKSKNTLVFVKSKSEFVSFLKDQMDYIEFDSVLWFAYPKGTSKIKTDINRDILRVTAEEFALTTVTAISIDKTWSALRLRPIDRVGK